jgi:hypothetical protein
MKLVEDSPQKLSYRWTSNLPRVGLTPGAYYDLPCLFPIIAIVIVIFLAIMPLLSGLFLWIVMGVALAWVVTITLIVWRENWKWQFREYCVCIDKQKQVIDFIWTRNSGAVLQEQYLCEEIQRIEPNINHLTIGMDILKSGVLHRKSFYGFKSEAERNACANALGEALDVVVDYDYWMGELD